MLVTQSGTHVRPQWAGSVQVLLGRQDSTAVVLGTLMVMKLAAPHVWTFALSPQQGVLQEVGSLAGSVVGGLVSARMPLGDQH